MIPPDIAGRITFIFIYPYGLLIELWRKYVASSPGRAGLQ
jgi:hypothetical protein